MKKVTSQPILPLQKTAAWDGALIRLLREYSEAINQAADHRLSEFVEIAGTYTAGENDHVILCTPSGAMTVTLPAASVMRNKRIIVKRVAATTHVITIQSSSGTIDGAASVTLTLAWEHREFFSNGVGWFDLVVDGIQSGVTESFVVPISDQTTALTTGTKMTWRMPYAFTLTEVQASVNTAQASGTALTFDIKESGTSLLSTLITIDNTEKTSTTAAAAVISDSAIAAAAELTFIIATADGATAAKGAVIYLIGHQ